MEVSVDVADNGCSFSPEAPILIGGIAAVGPSVGRARPRGIQFKEARMWCGICQQDRPGIVSMEDDRLTWCACCNSLMTSPDSLHDLEIPDLARDKRDTRKRWFDSPMAMGLDYLTVMDEDRPSRKEEDRTGRSRTLPVFREIMESCSQDEFPLRGTDRRGQAA